MNYNDNRFLAELRAAMEHTEGEPEGGILNDIPEGMLEPNQQTPENDSEGNTGSPGDHNETPDPGSGESHATVKGFNDANSPSGNMGQPGSGDSTPDPEAMEGIFTYFSNLRSDRNAKKKLENMSANELLPAWIQSVGCLGKYAMGAGGKDCLDRAIRNGTLYPRESFPEDPGVEMSKVNINGDTFYFCRISVHGDLQMVAAPEYDSGNSTSGQAISVKALTVYDMADDIYSAMRIDRKSGNDPAGRVPQSPAQTTVVEQFEMDDFLKNINRYNGGGKLIEIEQEQDAKDKSGNTGDPADEKQTPVSPSGDSKPDTIEKFISEAMDPSGNTGDPADEKQTPVSPSGDSKPLDKTGAEQKADDPDGNPDSPGAKAETDISFDSFIGMCETNMIRRQEGSLYIPDGMSLESYAMELGLGVIVARAMEATLSAEERRNLPDSAFGLPESRQWPIHDEAHVRSAIQNFHWCPKEQQSELAKNIIKAIRKFHMDNITVSEGNPFLKYYPNANVVPRKKPAKKNT